MPPINAEQEVYISKRGFEIRRGAPKGAAPPYVRLRPDVGAGMSQPTIVFQYVMGGPSNCGHPGDSTTDELVETILDMVGSSIHHDTSEGHTQFTTTPGVPIPIYVEDNAWMPVAETLASRFAPDELFTYLAARGFEPRKREAHPCVLPLYVLLGSAGVDEPIQYVYGAGHYGRAFHPSNTPLEELVDTIESLVRQGMKRDTSVPGDQARGATFATTPGVPIPIYYLDPAWQQTVDALVVKYVSRAKQEED